MWKKAKRYPQSWGKYTVHLLQYPAYMQYIIRRLWELWEPRSLDILRVWRPASLPAPAIFVSLLHISGRICTCVRSQKKNIPLPYVPFYFICLALNTIYSLVSRFRYTNSGNRHIVRIPKEDNDRRLHKRFDFVDICIAIDKTVIKKAENHTRHHFAETWLVLS